MFFLLLCIIHLLFANAQTGSAPSQLLVVTNPIPVERKNEIISISRSLLNQPNKRLFPSVRKKDKLLISQMVDKNRDDTWDELLVEISMAADTKDTLQIIWIEQSKLILHESYTNVHLSLRSDTKIPNKEIKGATRLRGFTQNIAKPFYQMEGPGIENDKVAFRCFFDHRNGKDIYGKITDTLVLEKVGVGASWHSLQPWGMDILKVGNSLGAGALAIEDDMQIFPLADADTTRFDNLYEGALAASFKLNFKNWDVGKNKRDGSETLILNKADFYYTNEIEVPFGPNQNLMAGMANFGTNTRTYQKHSEEFSSLSIYGKQADGTNTNLGLAIMFATDSFVNYKDSDVSSIPGNTSYVTLNPRKKGGKIKVYFFACWEKTDARFSQKQGFDDYLVKADQLLGNPIQLSIISK